MPVRITYFVHGTTTDNELNFSTGHLPGELSRRGVRESESLREQIKQDFAAIFSSDLKRAMDSAAIVFPGKQIIVDPRLRECDYGEQNGSPEKELKKKKHIREPFPGGESYEEVECRIQLFLRDLSKKYNNKHVAIIAHQAPQLALEVLTKGKTWEQAFKDDWRNKKAWQPGWSYDNP